MFEIELKSKELTEYVYITVDKDRAEPLYDSDLEQVEDVTLDAFDFIGEPTDETIYDLVFFKNLKNCMIVNMTISAGEIGFLISWKILSQYNLLIVYSKVIINII